MLMANRIFINIMTYTGNASLMYTLGLWEIYVNYCHNIMLKTKKLQGVVYGLMDICGFSKYDLGKCHYFDKIWYDCDRLGFEICDNCYCGEDNRLGVYPFVGYEFVTYNHDTHTIKELYCHHDGPIYGIRKSISKYNNEH